MTCSCGGHVQSKVLVDNDPPKLLAMSTSETMYISTSMTIDYASKKVMYGVPGVAYDGENRFTARLMEGNTTVWAYGGMKQNGLYELCRGEAQGHQ